LVHCKLQRADLGLERRPALLADAARLLGCFARLDAFGEPPSHFLQLRECRRRHLRQPRQDLDRKARFG
jgi:hypothetical protein